MGMFDSVYVACPKCGQSVEFQSKSGDCDMDVYDLQSAPDDVLVGIVGDAETCKCGAKIGIRGHTTVSVVLIAAKP